MNKKPDGKMILVVDDDPTVAKSVGMLLESGNYRVVCVCGGQEGLRAALAYRGISAAVVDLSMSPMNGQQFAVALLEVRPGLPLIYMTGHDITRITADPPGPILQKPFERTHLFNLLEAAISS